jgi:hypothetical protein
MHFPEVLLQRGEGAPDDGSALILGISRPWNDPVVVCTGPQAYRRQQSCEQLCVLAVDIFRARQAASSSASPRPA